MSSVKGDMLSARLVSLIVLAVTFVALLGLWSTLQAGVNSIDHKECRATIATAHGIKLEASGKFGLNFGVSAPVKCPVQVIEEFPEEDVTENKDVAFHVLNKMDLAWWATWSNTIPNTFKDFWKESDVCKQLYELWVDPNKISGVITADEMEVYASTIPISIGENNEEITFNRKMLISQGKKYFALRGTDAMDASFKGGDILEIYILAPQNELEGNSVILTNFQGSKEDKMNFINDAIRATRSEDLDNAITCRKLES